MSTVLLSFVVSVGLALVVLPLAGERRRRRARRRQARARVRERFVRFVEANCRRSVDESEVERFLDETAEVDALFGGSALPLLRLEVHDNALRLARLNAALDQGWVGPARREAIVAGRDDRRAWFVRTAAALDTLFDERRDASLERFNRAIGA